MVGKTGFEPATSWSQTKRSTKLSYFPKNDINYISFCLKSQEDFYFFKMACPRGLEPPAFWSVVRRSIQLSYRHIMAVPTGLEPAISSVTDWHVNHYTMEPLLQYYSTTDINTQEFFYFFHYFYIKKVCLPFFSKHTLD